MLQECIVCNPSFDNYIATSLCSSHKHIIDTGNIILIELYDDDYTKVDLQLIDNLHKNRSGIIVTIPLLTWEIITNKQLPSDKLQFVSQSVLSNFMFAKKRSFDTDLKSIKNGTTVH